MKHVKLKKEKISAEILAGIKVSLIVHLKNEAEGIGNRLALASIVEELLDDDLILIHMPIHSGYHYPLPREPLLMKFLVDLEPYAIWVQFEERVEREGFMFAKMRKLGKIEEYQQRDCFRLLCSLPVSVERLWRSEETDDPETEPAKGRILDLSDNGALFATDEDIEKGEKITLTFGAGDNETVKAQAIRVEKIENGKYGFKVATQFKIDKQQARRIYKYVMDEQLTQRRQRLGL